MVDVGNSVGQIVPPHDGGAFFTVTYVVAVVLAWAILPKLNLASDILSKLRLNTKP